MGILSKANKDTELVFVCLVFRSLVSRWQINVIMLLQLVVLLPNSQKKVIKMGLSEMNFNKKIILSYFNFFIFVFICTENAVKHYN